MVIYTLDSHTLVSKTRVPLSSSRSDEEVNAVMVLEEYQYVVYNGIAWNYNLATLLGCKP